MKLILITSLFFTNFVFAQFISGEVTIIGEAPKGTLYIFAKRFGGKRPMPLAVKRIKDPKFPVQFKLSQTDAMMKQIPFKGPFVVTARISPSGNATDKTGLEVSTTKEIKLGTKDIKLVLKK